MRLLAPIKLLGFRNIAIWRLYAPHLDYLGLAYLDQKIKKTLPLYTFRNQYSFHNGPKNHSSHSLEWKKRTTTETETRIRKLQTAATETMAATTTVVDRCRYGNNDGYGSYYGYNKRTATATMDGRQKILILYQ